MNRSTPIPTLPASLLWVILCLMLLAGCGGRKMESMWRDRPLAMDGRDDEWSGARVILDDASLGLGLMNDADDLYLTLSLTDRRLQMQVLTQGFTVWLDPHGGRNRAWGIRFPLGTGGAMGLSDGTSWAGRGPGRGRGGARGGQGGPDPRRLEALFERVREGAMLEIVDADGRPIRRFALAERQGVGLGIDYAHGRLVYELRIPLGPRGATLPTLESAPGKVVGVGFQVRQRDKGEHPQQGMGSRPAVGVGMNGEESAGPGMRGGGGRRGGGMARRLPPEAFQLWIRVQLATDPGERTQAG